MESHYVSFSIFKTNRGQRKRKLMIESSDRIVAEKFTIKININGRFYVRENNK